MAGHHIASDGRIGMAKVWLVVYVVNRRGDVIRCLAGHSGILALMKGVAYLLRLGVERRICSHNHEAFVEKGVIAASSVVRKRLQAKSGFTPGLSGAA